MELPIHKMCQYYKRVLLVFESVRVLHKSTVETKYYYVLQSRQRDKDFDFTFFFFFAFTIMPELFQ